MDIYNYLSGPVQSGPVAAREEFVHPYRIQDSYHWLRDVERTNRTVKEFLRQENAYSRAVLSRTRPLSARIYKEFTSFVDKSEDYPFKVQEYTYFCDRKNGLSRYTRLANGNQALVKDFNTYPASTLVGDFVPSPDNSKVAYTVDTKGKESFQLVIKDMRSQRETAVQSNLEPHIIWSQDSNQIFYVSRDKEGIPIRLMRYRIDKNKITSVYEEKEAGCSIVITSSVSKEYLFLKRGTVSSTQVYYLRLSDPEGEIKSISPRVPGRTYSVDHQKDSFLIASNKYMGIEYPGFALFKVHITQPSRWRLITYKPTEYITNIYGLYNGYILEVLVAGVQRIRIVAFGADESDFKEKVYWAQVAERRLQYSGIDIPIIYSSPTTPPELREFNLVTRNWKTLFTDSIPGLNPSLFSVERLFTKSNIPISLIYKKGYREKRPLLLEGYGSYGINIEPKFNHRILSLLNRNFIYAIAHVRGGTEMGNMWHEQGKLLNKMNSFNDFAECAHHLRSSNIASHITAIGSSAGGLLVAATINQNPDLFQTAILNVPFVDVLNTMMDPSHSYEYEEWGNPNNHTFFDYIQQYSPYENIPTNHFPDLLVRSGYNDVRVQYWGTHLSNLS
ncbi:hypothetical protein DSO57_1003734 [Entomophthora muscae]|uniref:Uncharacterized protein n=1 Tax=Entomophthora muscae TaxID=34485 RepID=A0ACC2SXA6_9FUNG|nr:hypothetical protein DSO57_1003734 [Entomophthora muscae]